MSESAKNELNLSKMPSSDSKSDFLTRGNIESRAEMVSDWIVFPSAFRDMTEENLKKIGIDKESLFAGREYLRCKDKVELMKFLGIKNRKALWRIEKSPKVQTLIARKKINWGSSKTPNVFLALYEGIMKHGDAARIRLWLEYFENYVEKSVVNIPELKDAADSIKEIVDKIKESKRERIVEVEEADYTEREFLLSEKVSSE